MATSLESALAGLSLDSAGPEDHRSILKWAEQSPRSDQAVKAKVVALLNLGQFSQITKDADEYISKGLDLEVAYALYRSGRNCEARKVLLDSGVLSAEPSSVEGKLHLLAQIHYKEESFDKAAQVYTTILKAAQDRMVEAEDDVISINVEATVAQAAFTSNDSSFAIRDVERVCPRSDTFESLFNRACRSIAKGDYARAGPALERARDLCEGSDLAEADKAAELSAITTQQLYLALQQDLAAQVQDLLSITELAGAPDAGTRKIGELNRLLAQDRLAGQADGGQQYSLLSQVQQLGDLDPNDGYISYQTGAYARNDAVLRLITHRIDGVLRKSAAVLKTAAGPTADPAVNNAAVWDAAAKVSKAATTSGAAAGADATKTLARLLGSAPPSSRLLGYSLAYIQLLLQAGRVDQAAAEITKVARQLLATHSADSLAILASPGFLGLFLALVRAHKKAPVNSSQLYIFRAVAKFWVHGTTGPAAAAAATAAATGQPDQLHSRVLARTPPSLFILVGSHLLQSWAKDDFLLAHSLFSLLAAAHPPPDRLVQTGLAAATAALKPTGLANKDRRARADASAAQPVHDAATIDSRAFVPVEQLVSGIDVDALERAGIPTASMQSTDRHHLQSRDPASLFAHLSLSSISKPSTGTKRNRQTGLDAKNSSDQQKANRSSNSKKRHRISREPKGGIPSGQKPDPERWLPLRDRSYFKPKGKKNKKIRGVAQGGVTQGGVVDESLSASASTQPVPTAKAPVKKGKKGRR